ncbi:hypothetical protein [Aurantimonas sp. Leaf443]|uniref:hypothetical protein n=1 Tax=Aurantimonas sp. Leaf443 TaxID=1736378 RepID=UPI0006F7E928|nr:hypothetical protein [Aurantimonas sp. Leaf443]KQT83996.1 hypothetical protein ASG48_11480 [Aurantimonas sp. Leaf443]
MSPRPLAAAFALVAVLLAGTADPVLADRWIAVSNTAMAITGDLEIDDRQVTFQTGATLAFSDLVADTIEVDGETMGASVYRVATPGNPVLLNGNRLCGAEATYLAIWSASQDVDDAGVILAAFEGTAVPTSNEEACAIFAYEDTGGNPLEGIDPMAEPGAAEDGAH